MKVNNPYYCPKCGTRLKKESDVPVLFCPEDQFAWTVEFMEGLIKMAVDWRDSADERIHGIASP